MTMRSSPMNGARPPFDLPSGIVYFTDWRYIDHGYLRWLTPADEPVNTMPAPDPLPAMHGDSEWLPQGIRIETVPGRVDSAPVLRASDLGESIFFGGSVINDGGQYRLFYESVTGENPNHDKVLRIAESDDGVRWRFPKTGNPDVASARHHNKVLQPGFSGYHGGCVFMDPHGPSDERYKSVWMGMVSRLVLARYVERWPDDVDPMAVFNNHIAGTPDEAAAWGLYAAVSADGYNWRLLDEPLLIQHSDTFNAATFDVATGQYVVYPRTWYYGRRAVGRAVSSDFRHFSGLQQVLWPDPSLRPSDTWYTSGYARIPGAPDYQLMFATLWAQVDDTFTPVLHSSTDGVLWQRVPGKPMLEHGPMGSWYACGGAIPSLVALPGDEWGSLFMGWHVPHKFPRTLPGFGQVGWVRWTRGRLAALRADEDAVFNLFPLNVKGRRLVLNYRTKASGWIRIALNGNVPLRKMEDCDIISGDELDRVVSWKGVEDMGQGEGEGVQIRIEMRAADLYSIRFE